MATMIKVMVRLLPLWINRGVGLLGLTTGSEPAVFLALIWWSSPLRLTIRVGSLDIVYAICK